jgi:hypothetical protein
VDAGGGEAEDDVARLHPGTVDQRVAVDDPDAGRGEVELVLRYTSGISAVSPPISATPAVRQTFRRALDELRDLLELDPGGGDVVEQDERARRRR